MTHEKISSLVRAAAAVTLMVGIQVSRVKPWHAQHKVPPVQVPHGDEEVAALLDREPAEHVILQRPPAHASLMSECSSSQIQGPEYFVHTLDFRSETWGIWDLGFGATCSQRGGFPMTTDQESEQASDPLQRLASCIVDGARSTHAR